MNVALYATIVLKMQRMKININVTTNFLKEGY